MQAGNQRAACVVDEVRQAKLCAMSACDEERHVLCVFVQGKQGVDASLQLLEGKLGVDQIMSLCQALGYFPTGAARTKHLQICFCPIV